MGKFAKITQGTSPHLAKYLNEMSKWGEVGSLFYSTDEDQLQFGDEVRFKELCSFIEQVRSIMECDRYDKLTYTV